MSATPEVLGPLVAGVDPAMAIVTTQSRSGERGGCLVGFHCQCSISPERYAVWLSVKNRTHRLSVDATHLAVHFLATDDHPLAARFGGISGDHTDGGGDAKFEGVAWRSGPGGVPVLGDVERWFVGRIVDRRPGGDHTWLELEPEDGPELPDAPAARAWSPLRLGDVTDIDPGQDA